MGLLCTLSECIAAIFSSRKTPLFQTALKEPAVFSFKTPSALKFCGKTHLIAFPPRLLGELFQIWQLHSPQGLVVSKTIMVS